MHTITCLYIYICLFLILLLQEEQVSSCNFNDLFLVHIHIRSVIRRFIIKIRKQISRGNFRRLKKFNFIEMISNFLSLLCLLYIVN